MIPILAMPKGQDTALQLNYIGDVGSGTGTTTRTFSSVSIGAAPTTRDRYIIASMGWIASGTTSSTLSSGTIGGNAAAVAGSQFDSSSVRAACGVMIYGPLNSGTTANITFTWSADPGSSHRCFVHSLLVPRPGTFSLTPEDTFSDVEPNPSDTVTCSANSAVVAICAALEGEPISWSGLTEDDEVDLATADPVSVASEVFSSAQVATSIGAVPTGGESASAMFGAAWNFGG